RRAAPVARELQLAALEAVRRGGTGRRRRPKGVPCSGRGRDRLRRRLRTRPAQNSPSHPDRPRAHARLERHPPDRSNRRQQASGKGSVVGFLASLAAQGTLTALDTPDTRSWETLPARIAIARVRVKAGQHAIFADARGVYRKQTIEVPRGGWAVVSLMALR